MCYDDGTLAPWPGITPCAGAMRFDCNGDDYFSPHPAASSYLAGHWNMFDSSFMCAAGACDAVQARTPPHAAFTVTSGGRPVTSVRVGKGVTLDGRGSTAAAGTPLFAWDLDGDGSTDVNEPVVVRRAFKPGRWKIRLRITDAEGALSTATRTISVVRVARRRSASSSARLRSALATTIARLRRGRLRGLARAKAVRVAFRAPGTGRLWLRVTSGGRRLASASGRCPRAGRRTVSARVTPRARAMLRRRALRLTVSVAFRDGHGRVSRRSGRVTLRR
jgi:PKD domain